MTPEDLAELLENAAVASPQARKHLETCPACLHLYSQGVADRLAAADTRSGTARSRILAESAIRAGTGTGEPERRSRFRWPVLAAAALAVILATGVLVTHRGPRPRELPLPGPIAAAAVDFAENSLMLRGTEQTRNSDSTVRGARRDSVDRSVEALWSQYQDRRDPVPGIAAITGLVAKTRTNTARAYLRQFLSDHPDDPDGLLLQAVVRYQGGETDRAQELLRDVADRYPAYRELARLNLGLVLLEDGRQEEALGLFRDLQAKARDPRIRARAAREVQASG